MPGFLPPITMTLVLSNSSIRTSSQADSQPLIAILVPTDEGPESANRDKELEPAPGAAHEGLPSKRNT